MQILRRGLIAVAAISAVAGAAWADVAATAQSVTIHRDSFGVPHIVGPTDASVVFGLAYAQAQDNFPHLEDNFIRALGRAAEVHGESALLDDQMVAALEIVRWSQNEYERGDRRMRSLYDSYAAGLNYYVAQHPEEPRALLARFEPWFPLALLRYKYYLQEFVGYAGLDRANYRPISEPAPPERPEGSNAWAIAPSRSASGAAMLFINPHVGFYGPAQYYESHLISGEGWNFSGVGRYGFPFPYMGHSETLGWAHTDNYSDIGDLYIENFDDPSRPNEYRYGNGYRRVRETTHEIGVRVGDTIETRRFVVRRTHHGPIVSHQNGAPLSIRLSRLEDGGWFDQWYAMSRARNFAQFRRALERVAIPYMNIVYADREGNIFYAYNGAVPRRTSGFDYLAPIDGADPRMEWQGYHRFSDLPQVLNPAAGFVQNTNSSPFFTTTGPDNPHAEMFPAYMIGPETFNPRARASHRLLANGDRFDFEQWAVAATDTYVIEADRHILDLVSNFPAFESRNPETAHAIRPMLDELVAWDRRAEVDSVGMTIFARWFGWMRQMNFPTNPDVPYTTLNNVRTMLETDWDTWRVPWGDVNRLQRRDWSGLEFFDDTLPSLPVRGAPGWLGIIFNFYTDNPLARQRAYGRMGNSYVSVIEFGPQTRARSIVYYGQSGRPDSPHYFDQAPLYARGEFKPAPTTLEEVRAASVVAYHPGEEAD